MADGFRRSPALPIELLGNSCCGCGACEASCPIGCIQLVPDSLGFRIPDLDVNRCIACGKCSKVCPVLGVDDRVKTDALAAFWVKNSDARELDASSSGGVFSLLARHTLAAGGTVYGVSFDGIRAVAFVRVDSCEGLLALRKSKYLQANIAPHVYAAVRADLNADRDVLFTGTACQVAAVRSYLGKLVDSDHLVCAEVICHGVPSPKLWGLYVASLEKHQGSHLTSFSFREKHPSWDRYSVRADFEDGTAWEAPYLDCWYMAAFMADLPLRSSCYSCPFKRRSGADLVLGDFWGIRNVFPRLRVDDGVSSVIADTPKGARLVRALDGCDIGETSYEDILKGNQSLEYATQEPEERAEFTTALKSAGSLAYLMKRWPLKKSARSVWVKRVRKIRALTDELGLGNIALLTVDVFRKALVLMMKGTSREALKKMAAISVDELRAKTSGRGTS